METRQKKPSVYDKTHKGWRGPILHDRASSAKESQPVTPRLAFSEVTVYEDTSHSASTSAQASTCQSQPVTQRSAFSEDTVYEDTSHSAFTSTQASSCQGVRINPNYATFPTVTWKSPPRAQHRRQRTSAFDWERRDTEGSLLRNSFQRKELDFFKTNQIEQQYLIKELDRTQAKSKRMEQLIKEIARVREDNKLLSSQIHHYKESKKSETPGGEQQAVETTTYISVSAARHRGRRERTYSFPNGNDQVAAEDTTY